MSKRPIIGVTLDAEEAGGYSPFPWYALRKEYFKVLQRLGATPIALPHEIDAIEHYLTLIDGLVLTGGDVDIPPELYGETSHESVVTKEGRTAFEWKLAQAALAKNLPILGICAGQQLLNVILGGTLHQHIPDAIPNALEHQQPTPRNQPWHAITITADTLLHRITGTTLMQVNSNHHQAVKDVGKNVIVNATAPDGVIEGIESTAHRFCLGVEWHPEHEISPEDSAIFQALIRAAAT